MKHPERLAGAIWTVPHGCLCACAMLVVISLSIACVLMPTPGATPSPIATFRLEELQTAIANLETAVPQLYATACALSTVQAPVETLSARVDADIALVDQAIATVQALRTCMPVVSVTATATPTPVQCAQCSYDGQCASGYFCKLDCIPGRGVCVRRTSPNADCNLCRTQSALLVGIATHYDPDKHSFRCTKSGALYDPGAMAAAVDDSLWTLLRGKKLHVCDEDNCIEVFVNDTGKLDEAGWFVWGKQRIGAYDVLQWHPAASDVPGAVQIVIDLTPRAYCDLDPRGLVWIWAKE